MDYVWCRNKSIRDANWQSCTGGSTGIDTDVIKKCSEGDEGKQLVARSFAESKALGHRRVPDLAREQQVQVLGHRRADHQVEPLLAQRQARGVRRHALGAGGAQARRAKEPGCGN